jgi:Flp pilus assembly protein TadG
MRRRVAFENRRGMVVVEAAFVLPIMLILMLGIWEVGRLIQINQIVINAAREGARFAAGGYTNGTPVTATMVQQAVQDYMTAAGMPAAAVSGSQVSLICQATPSWTNPCDALPLDQFQVKVVIPAGTAFNSLRWTPAKLTSTSQMTVTVNWQSLNNSKIVVSATLPL